VRALVVSNMLPDGAHPERGSFVRDQVAALRAIEGLDVDLFEFSPGAAALARAPAGARRAIRPARAGPSAGRRRYDVVHAHFGLAAWPALAIRSRVRALTLHGTDLLHPRTRLATAAVLPLIDLVAVVSAPLLAALPGRSARRAKVLPCGVDVERFRPLARERAREELRLDPRRPYVLFPADAARREKRHDRAQALCQAIGVELLTLGGVAPERVPLWVNAANAVLVPSEREGFGLAVLEALACDVPVLATPVGIHAEALDGVAGSLCAPFDLARWRAALEPHLAAVASDADASTRTRAGDPASGPGGTAPAPAGAPHPGRASALRYSARRMAERVAEAWRAGVERAG
jgi:glycosyltransferase involved in cell wall biosynthesis